jgi:hypothetical protein
LELEDMGHDAALTFFAFLGLDQSKFRIFRVDLVGNIARWAKFKTGSRAISFREKAVSSQYPVHAPS